MPFLVDPDPARGLLRVVASDPVTFDESMRTIREVAGRLAGHGWVSVADVREMTYFPTVAELKTLALEFVHHRHAYSGGVAFVVSNERHYALGSLLAAMAERGGVRIAVFRDENSAEQWTLDVAD